MGQDNKYTFCDKCFRGTDPNKKTKSETYDPQDDTFKDDDFIVIDDPMALHGKPQKIQKNKFTKKRNNRYELEKFVTCEHCRKRSHAICVWHSSVVYKDQPYICHECKMLKSLPEPLNR